MKTLLPESKRPRAPEVGRLNVCAKQCPECLFGTTPHLPWDGPGGGEEKVRRIVQARFSHFICHEWSNVMCRGFYNKYGSKLGYVKMAQRIRAIQWVGRAVARRDP